MTTSAHHGSDTRGRSPATTGIQKRVLAGGSVGQFIEFYDFTLYGCPR